MYIDDNELVITRELKTLSSFLNVTKKVDNCLKYEMKFIITLLSGVKIIQSFFKYKYEHETMVIKQCYLFVGSVEIYLE